MARSSDKTCRGKNRRNDTNIANKLLVAANNAFELTTQYNTVQYSTVQYSTVQYSTVQYSSIQYSTVQYSTVQYSTVQYSTVQYSTVQYSTVQYSTVQTLLMTLPEKGFSVTVDIYIFYRYLSGRWGLNDFL